MPHYGQWQLVRIIDTVYMKKYVAIGKKGTLRHAI